MLLSSVIIVLREVIEAALLFSILIALSKQMDFGLKWIVLSLSLGISGAIIYALNIDTVSEWFDGVGQEVSNAFIQFSLYFLLLIYITVLTRFVYQQKTSHLMLVIIFMIITTLAITREGSEILLYFFSVTHNDNHFAAVLIGMTIGAGIGISVGLLFYYLLQNMNPKWSFKVGTILLILVAAGLVSQASLLLIQADWLEAQLPLWDVSDWLPETSVIGQLLYALLGYEATPTATQFGLYLAGLLLPVFLIAGLKFKYSSLSSRP